ncbi:MAG: hypothetical protein AAGA30_13310 [Planctomycetota bacterium]
MNESHYLTKAKHFWNPEWCAGDLFMESANAHYFFFLICGWPTLFLSLDVYAWIGRVSCWLFLAISWQKLNRSFGVRDSVVLFSAILFGILTDRFDMAGEWVIGGFEAKSISYIFVLWSISRLLEGDIFRCLVPAGFAIAFHAVI